MRRLWVQLAFGFALITLISVGVVALLTNQRTSLEFRGFFARSQLQQSGIVEQLAGFYAQNQSWNGVDQLLSTLRLGPGQGMGPGNHMAELQLADATGRVVAGNNLGSQLSSSTLSSSVSITVADQPVGYLLIQPANATLPAAARGLLNQLNQALIQAGLLGIGLGIGLGMLLARRMAAPLDRLAQAANRVAQGDLHQQLPLHGPQEIASAARAFNQMTSTLQRVEDQRRQMIADIAHELRTPLTVLQGNLRAILDDVYPLNKHEIGTIYEETAILKRLVDDLHQLALAEAGQLSLQIEQVEITSLLQQRIDLFIPAANLKQISVITDGLEQPHYVQADAERTAQIIHNLLSNALRYTPEGGQIRLRCQDDQRHVQISVCDTGPGMSPEDVSHVFERFWRADQHRSRAQGGSGLGLAIAQQLAQLQHGQLAVTSQLGIGSCFQLSLISSPNSHTIPTS